MTDKTSPPQPIFETHALATLDRAKSIFAGRGTEYGDTWRECRFLKMAAVARELGLAIPAHYLRALATAAFADMKYWRFLGGFKDDSLVDGINYDAFLAEEMRRVTESPPVSGCPPKCVGGCSAQVREG
jgi:hypothetical protein